MDNIKNIVYFFAYNRNNMWWSKKKVKYKPVGKIGHFCRGDYPYYYTIVFERLYDVADRSKVKILEIDIRRDCTKTKEQCLSNASAGEWVSTAAIKWETDEQYRIRTHQPFQEVYENHEELRNDDVDYTPHLVNPLRHNFLQNNNH
jgi:hypothetical protein